MALVGRKLRGLEGGRVAYMCPGCREMHQVRVDGEGYPSWDFNGDYDRPTLSPSVLVKFGHYADGRAGPCWCTYEQRFGRPAPFKCSVCHSFVRDGRAQFLDDCTHALAGQTVDLPDLESV